MGHRHRSQAGDATVGAEGPAWGPSVSPDGRLVAGAWPEHNKVRVFPAVGGEPWVIHAEYAQDTAFSPDGRRLAVAAGGSGTVHVVDLETRREVFVLTATEGILDLAWSPDGRWLATSGNFGATVYEARTGRLRPVTPGPTGRVNSVAWSPDSNLLATASEDGTARVFAVDGGAAREVVRLAAQDMRNGVRSVAFSPDGRELMTSDWAITSVKVWDVRDEAAPEIVNIPVDAGCNVRGGSDSGRPVGVAGRGRWPGRALRHRNGTPRAATAGTTVGAGGPPAPRAQSRRALLALMGWELPFPVWDTRTGEIAFVVGEGHEGLVLSVQWDGSGERLAVSVTRERGASTSRRYTSSTGPGRRSAGSRASQTCDPLGDLPRRRRRVATTAVALATIRLRGASGSGTGA